MLTQNRPLSDVLSVDVGSVDSGSASSSSSPPSSGIGDASDGASSNGAVSEAPSRSPSSGVASEASSRASSPQSDPKTEEGAEDDGGERERRNLYYLVDALVRRRQCSAVFSSLGLDRIRLGCHILPTLSRAFEFFVFAIDKISFITLADTRHHGRNDGRKRASEG